VDAVSSLFHGQQPDLSWINAGVSTSAYIPGSAHV